MTAGVGAKVPHLLLSVAAESVEANKSGCAIDFRSIREDDLRIRNDPWYNVPGMWTRFILTTAAFTHCVLIQSLQNIYGWLKSKRTLRTCKFLVTVRNSYTHTRLVLS